MYNFRYRKILPLVVCLGLLGPAVLVAQESRPVYLVSQPGQSDVWTMNMSVQTEALRMYVPVVFVRNGKTVNLGFDTPSVSFSSVRETIVSRTGNGILTRYDVAIVGAPPLPKADRSVTIRFSLTDLRSSETAAAETPGFYALQQAILRGPYSKGRAWVQSMNFSDNRFVVVVGLKR